MDNSYRIESSESIGEVYNLAKIETGFPATSYVNTTGRLAGIVDNIALVGSMRPPEAGAAPSSHRNESSSTGIETIKIPGPKSVEASVAEWEISTRSSFNDTTTGGIGLKDDGSAGWVEVALWLPVAVVSPEATRTPTTATMAARRGTVVAITKLERRDGMGSTVLSTEAVVRYQIRNGYLPKYYITAPSRACGGYENYDTAEPEKFLWWPLGWV